MPSRKILVADLLCGAGGSSTGCAHALAELGLQMELVCVNHWGVAIDTHKMNHPEARHYVQDIGTVRPHILVPEGYLDLLMASPSCTHHSVARGGKPTSDQQRSDPWHIITWLTELRVKRLIIENVWEFKDWGPVNARTGKPVKSRKGEYFMAWISAIRALGFEPEWRKLNAADFGDATTRQRFILMARSDRKRVLWPMPSHARAATTDGKLDLFDGLKPWRPARDIIDWSIKGRSIYGRKKSLAPATLARIHAGALKFGWPEGYIVTLRNHMTAQGLDLPIPTVAANGTHIGLAQPMLVKQHFRRDAQSVDEPAPTITTVARVGLVEPFILNRHGDGYGETRAHAVDEPMPTANTSGAGYVVEPMVVNMKGQSTVSDIDAPLPTQTAHAGHLYVAEPFVMSRHSEGAARSIDDPTPTQVAKQSHLLISPYYGSGSGETCTDGDVPLPTVTGNGRFGMVVPVTHADGSNRARDVSDPLPTLTTANRGELAFIAAAFGEREGQDPRVHGIEEPTPTICATGRVNLVEATPEYDILFRMLEPHELAAAMGFGEYEFAGNKTQKIKQIGNAVSVAKMRACVKAMMADAAETPDHSILIQRAAE